ncbi:MAG: DHH family phosphoesterase [Epsilonproteobacteria bacterium]|nr:DHH family phosphoesterase [Campylobacterota bacterium]
MEQNVKVLIDSYERVTILSHINPDADTLGTALGIYALLKAYGKQVEVVNADRALPKNLDFLPNFKKIKHQIDFDSSLVITCDSGSVDLLGFNLEGRDILNIDHHPSNTNYGLVNVVKADYASASQVAFELFRDDFPINQATATCFYTALVSDTQYFTTNNVTKEVFDVASDMITFDIDISEVAYNLKQRRSLTSLRILNRTLETLVLSNDGELAIMVATKESIKESGAIASDLLGVVDYGLSLATVKIALLISEWDDHIRVSIRSKKSDVSPLAIAYGGGHNNAAGFKVKNIEMKVLIEALKVKIKELGLLNET